MNDIVIKDCFLSLAWIKSGEKTPHHYEVVFELKDIVNTKNPYYVAFLFNSFDMMYVYLKSLARSCNVGSIDNLKSVNFPVKIEYSETLNSPPIFEKLYLNYESATIWPYSKNYKGHFLVDTLV